MSVIVKITLVVALLLSIVIPFGAFAAGEKTKGRYKTALAVNLFMFFGTMVFAGAVMFSGNAYAAEAAPGLHPPRVWVISPRRSPPACPA